jgi:selenocysteine lyase/cysteine desulfurase
MSDLIGGTVAIILLIAVVIGGLFGLGFLYKNYNVWSQEMTGKANLAEAEWSKKIAVEEAKAREESATLDARAEVARAKGVRESNEIIAEGLGGPEGYLRYLYINTLNDLDTQLIYVPTEAGLPILEANRL